MNIIKKYKYIFFVAIILRLLIMPFLFHPDLKTQYFHSNHLTKGVINIYQYIDSYKEQLPYQDSFNYPITVYFFQGGWVFLTQFFLTADFDRWMNNWSEDWFSDEKIFRYLFILKIPYLIFDILTGLFIAMLLAEKYRVKGLILWFFNPITIYIIYGLANFDIIPTFLTLLAMYLLVSKKYFRSGLMLGLGASFKFFPLLFLPFFILFIFKQKKFKELFIFLGGFLLIFEFFTLLFYDYITNISSGGLAKKLFDSRIATINEIPIPWFLVLSGVFSIYSLSRKNSWMMLNFCISSIFLIFVATVPFNPQWLLWGIPFIVIFLSKKLKLLFPVGLIILGFVGFVLTLKDRFLTIGLTSPIVPNIYEVGFLETTIFMRMSPELLSSISKLFLVSGSLLAFVIINNMLKDVKADEI